MDEETIKTIVQVLFYLAGLSVLGGLISYCENTNSNWDRLLCWCHVDRLLHHQARSVGIFMRSRPATCRSCRSTYAEEELRNGTCETCSSSQRIGYVVAIQTVQERQEAKRAARKKK